MPGRDEVAPWQAGGSCSKIAMLLPVARSVLQEGGWLASPRRGSCHLAEATSLAHWAIRRNPFWRNWPRAQAVVYQGTSLFLAATLVAYSLVGFYFLFVLRPSLERKRESLRQEAEKYLPRPSR
jgi:hypothetical protein